MGSLPTRSKGSEPSRRLVFFTYMRGNRMVFHFTFAFQTFQILRTSKLSENSFPVTAPIFFIAFILDDWRTSEYAYKDGRLIFRVRTRLNTIKRYLLSKFSICGNPCVCFEFLALGLITSSCRSWFLTLFLCRMSQISRELLL